MVAGRNPLIGALLPELDPGSEFSAVTIPNPHLVARVGSYVESDLIAMGERVAARPDVFPAGANLSVLLPLQAEEVFVRTFERGAGLTASCGSGMAAARAVHSRIGPADPERHVAVRNAGGTATASLRIRPAQWFPVLRGQRHLRRPRATSTPAPAWPGACRFLASASSHTTRCAPATPLDEQNALRLRTIGIETAALETAAAARPRARRRRRSRRRRATSGRRRGAAQQRDGRGGEHAELPALVQPSASVTAAPRIAPIAAGPAPSRNARRRRSRAARRSAGRRAG